MTPEHPSRPSGARHRSRRRIRRRVMVATAAVAGLAVATVLVAVLGGGGRSAATVPAAGWTAPGGTRVYGRLGPEGVPLELGAPLGAGGGSGAAVDGVQCNTGEQIAYHHHVHLAVFVDGRPRPIPYGVGMVAPITVTHTASGSFAGEAACFYWIHVHAQDGVVHLESPADTTFTLGQVFDIWHQGLSVGRLGAFSGLVHATVDGRPWDGDPSRIPLDQHTQIVLDLGAPTVEPPPISWKGTGL